MNKREAALIIEKFFLQILAKDEARELRKKLAELPAVCRVSYLNMNLVKKNTRRLRRKLKH